MRADVLDPRCQHEEHPRRKPDSDEIDLPPRRAQAGQEQDERGFSARAAELWMKDATDGTGSILSV